ncbi:MAG: AgmX/PglI C-terminal domain-containing protein [Deltaproteobacteria bacterium]|nr:AgmX/PglI C-terminal domain-containing protein [Deltaproteobacteria bacterium]
MMWLLACAPKEVPPEPPRGVATVVEMQASEAASADRQAITEAVATTPVRPCFEALLARTPAAHGEVVVEFTVGTAGLVTESRAAFATLGDDEAAACVADAVRRVQFPPRGEELGVRYPFVLITDRTPPEVARALKARYGLLPERELDPSGDPRAPIPPGVVVVW